MGMSEESVRGPDQRHTVAITPCRHVRFDLVDGRDARGSFAVTDLCGREK
jgi:hypothetical protein